MKLLFHSLYFSLTLLLLMSCGSKKVHYMEGSLTDVFLKARKQGKKVFILVADTSCRRCKAFSAKLDAEESSRSALNRDYLCYKAYTNDPATRDIAQILKCRGIPCPYFFNADGSLITFGYPNSPVFDASHTERISFDPKKFMEFYRINATIEEYKRMVYYSLNAYLLMQEALNENKPMDSAYALANRSIQIKGYLYNYYLAFKMASKMGLDKDADRDLEGLASYYSAADYSLYGPLMKSIGAPETAFAKDPFQDGVGLYFKNTIVVQNVKAGRDLEFTFPFQNLGASTVKVNDAEHPCSCIKLDWTRTPVAVEDTGSIRGVFHAEGMGHFSKEIYVHLDSKDHPMLILTLEGDII
ncbi:hypothetical protein DCC81_25230 [Chitinophaga parva]|uniref:Thioredoxin domain-containing protein n=1 Tax=Chitinophaga parva TaxID=2169414 RepID=A0A2T7BB85_9BACT|nr:DUF1573 domain-containing protein [Chitinophaga parva]PUZ21313.1 hypothetical protein DCC81_25230 [Chitinophaga parva]